MQYFLQKYKYLFKRKNGSSHVFLWMKCIKHLISPDVCVIIRKKEYDMKIKLIGITAALALMLSLCACGNNRDGIYMRTYVGCFDTVSFIKGYAENERKFEEYAALFHERLKYYDALYDIYDEYDFPNLKTVNDKAGGDPVEVSQDIVDMLDFSVRMYELTAHKTNIAMGAVLEIWHDCREDGNKKPQEARLPTDSELADAAMHTDISRLEVDRENLSVRLADSRMRLDVGAVAKGFSAQKVAEELRAAGFANGIISIGGNTVAIGSRKDADVWRIGIREPSSGSDEEYFIKVGLSDMSLVTSGSYQRFYTVNGKKYHHIIDPGTLMPAEGYLSVSVISADSGIADALSTALFCMDINEGLRLVEDLDNVYAVWVKSDGTVVESKGFDNFVVG